MLQVAGVPAPQAVTSRVARARGRAAGGPRPDGENRALPAPGNGGGLSTPPSDPAAGMPAVRPSTVFSASAPVAARGPMSKRQHEQCDPVRAQGVEADAAQGSCVRGRPVTATHVGPGRRECGQTDERRQTLGPQGDGHRAAARAAPTRPVAVRVERDLSMALLLPASRPCVCRRSAAWRGSGNRPVVDPGAW